MSFLKVEKLKVRYGMIRALHGINLEIKEGEMVSLLGANGAGKSTMLQAISRMIPVEEGNIFFLGETILPMAPHALVAKKVAYVPEGRGIFSTLTVHENLELATWTNREKAHLKKVYKEVFNLFPRLEERKKQLAGTLSGGEQQMLAIARAMMTGCRLLLLDEPFMGLSPLLAKEVFRTLKEINRQGTSILLVEQNVALALQFSHRGYVLENGHIVLQGSAEQLLKETRVKEAYLGQKR